MYFRARSYSTTLGRFISRDPLGYVDGMNLYAGYFVPGGRDPLGLSNGSAPCPGCDQPNGGCSEGQCPRENRRRQGARMSDGYDDDGDSQVDEADEDAVTPPGGWWSSNASSRNTNSSTSGLRGAGNWLSNWWRGRGSSSNASSRSGQVNTPRGRCPTGRRQAATAGGRRAGNRSGRPGNQDHRDDVERNNNQESGRLRPRAVGRRVPDGVGAGGQVVDIRGRTIDPGPVGRVVVESERFRQNGQMVGDGREQIRDIRAADPNATIVVTDPANPNAPPVIYRPHTQPPPRGRLRTNHPTHVPYP